MSLDPIASPAVTVFDGRTGAIVAEWGANTFAMPHGLTVDADGNVWLTDVALQQVFKYSHDGTVIERVGRWGNYDGQLEIAHALAVGPDGAVYVGDATGKRIQKFVSGGR